jgi:hypothetical protein
MYFDIIDLGLKEEQEEGFNWDAENNIRTNFGNR